MIPHLSHDPHIQIIVNEAEQRLKKSIFVEKKNRKSKAPDRSKKIVKKLQDVKIPEYA
jgi:hypothetical protein